MYYESRSMHGSCKLSIIFPGEDLERSCQGFFRLFSIPAASFVMYSQGSGKPAIIVG